MIGSSENRISYNGNGIATEFAYNFIIIEKSDIKVLHVAADGTEQLLTKDYYVDMKKSVVLYPGYAPGAEIPEQNRPPILPVGERLVLYREVPITQESALDKHWPFNVIENGLDKLTIICQQIWDRLQRSFYVSESTSTNFDPKVPIEAGKTFRVKDDGTGFEVTEDPGKVIDGATALLKQTTEQAESANEAATNAQSAANAAEAVAPEYAKTKEVLDNIVSYTNTATEQASIATAKANVASTSAANANSIATQLTEYLATKESITAPAVDKTLLIEGAAADAKAVGELKSDLNKLYETRNINIMHNVKGVDDYISYDGMIIATPGVKAMDLTVSPDEVYVVSGNISASMSLWGVYDQNNSLIAHDEVRRTTSGFVEEEITMPDNAYLLRVFGYYNTDITIKYKKNYFKPTLDSFSYKKWIAIGDSLTDAVTLQGGKNYVDFIAKETGCNAVNLGVGGSGILKNQKYYGRVNTIPTDADIVSVFGSFNDYSYVDDGNLGTSEDDGSVSTPTTIGGALNKFLLELYSRCPDVKIIIVSPICWTWNCPYDGVRKVNSENYVKLLEDVAKKWSIPYLDLFHTANVRLWDANTSKKYTINNDGTHLTEEGHREFIYKKVMEKLRISC